MKRILTLFMAVLTLTACMLPALAANVVQVALPVSVRVSGEIPDETEYVTIILTAVDPANPMPDGAVDGVYTMRMRAGSQSAFPEIRYTEPGNYHYTVKQKRGYTPGCSYDSSLYLVEVCIAPGDDGIYPVIVVQENEGTVKRDGITFRNTYRTVTPTPNVTLEPGTTPTPVPTPTRRPAEELPPTGVEDYWMFYLGGAAAFLLLAAFMVCILLRPEEANAADGGNPFRGDCDE